MTEIKNEEDVIIDENFVPNNLINFAYDFKNNYFTISNCVNNNKILNEVLKKEANEIIKVYSEIKRNKNKKTDLMNSFESSNESQTDLEGEDYSSSFTSKNKSNNVLNEDEKIKINNNMLISDNDSIKKIENEKNNESKNNNNYYKVNLTKIHFLIYDFDKDSIVEHKDNNNISKIEKIIKDLSKNVYTDFGKDENYPIIHLKTKLINNEKKDKFIQKEKENFNKEEKIIEEKLKTEINNNKDEISIKNLKLLLLISYIFMLVCGIVNIYLYLNFYSTFKKIFNMIHTTANIKY